MEAMAGDVRLSNQLGKTKDMGNASTNLSNRISYTNESASYDVFISYRRSDTMGFVSFLHKDLVTAGLRTFLDCKSIDIGEDRLECIEHSLKRTSIGVVVFSENFAQSEWSLRELHVMLNNPSLRVLPVFYKVEPQEVRFPERGRLANGFGKLCRRHTKEVIDQFREDLAVASKLMGWAHSHMGKWLEGDLVRAIVSKALELANKPLVLDVGKYVVGVEEVATDPIASTNLSNRISYKNESVSYDVFISHKGPDTKTGFVSFLYKDLVAVGLRTFLDCKSVDIGEDSWECIEHSLKRTSIGVVVLSENFAQSQCCLRELHVMLNNPSLRMLPVFYKVDPWEVRVPESGQLRCGFEKLCRRHTEEVTNQWREDLRKVSMLNGWEHCYGREWLEGDLVTAIVSKALELANKPLVLDVGKYVVGVEEVVTDPNAVKLPSAFSIDIDNTDMEVVVDVNDNELDSGVDAQEWKDETLSLGDFQAPNAVELPRSLTTILEDQRYEVDMPVDVNNLELHDVVADFQVPGAMELPNSLAIVLEDERHEVDISVNVDNVKFCDNAADFQVPNAMGLLSSLTTVLEGQRHEVDMPLGLDNVDFQVEKDDTDVENAIDVDDNELDNNVDAQECKDEISALANFQVPDDISCGRLPSTFGHFKRIVDLSSNSSDFVKVGNAAAMDEIGLYLGLGEDRVDAVLSISAFKFNIQQCKYLADKLQIVVQSASLYLNELRGDLGSFVDVAKVIDVFKFLLALAKQIESFVQGCCKDSWIQSALTLTNVWEYVALVGFNLELCRVAFCMECAATECLSLDEVEVIYEVEVGVVKKKYASDVDALSQKIALEGPSLGNENKDLAFYLLQRLNQVKPILGAKPNLFEGNIGYDVGWFQRLCKWVKPSEKLGRGASGTVYKAMWFGTPIAKKTFSGTQYQDFTKEVKVLSPLSHTNVMSIFCSEQNRWNCSIIMELMDEDLHALMQRRVMEKTSSSSRILDDSCPSPFPILEAVDIMLQIGEGGKYLHNQRIVHRDLKSMNILAKNLSGEDLDGYVHVKVADFGMSKTKEKSTRFSAMSYNEGTSRWMAPEIIRLPGSGQGSSSSIEGPKLPFKRDIYSFGMVCFEILTGLLPFPFVEYDREVKLQVLQGKRPKLPKDPQKCPPLLKKLIERCWSPNPQERPTFIAICSTLKYLKYQLMRSYCLGLTIEKAA